MDSRLRNLGDSLQVANNEQTKKDDIQASTRKLQRDADALKF